MKRSLWRKIRNWRPLYWLRTHTLDRYHLVDVRGEDRYEWGWIDRDHKMTLACWKILKEFVEREDPGVGLRTMDDYYDLGPTGRPKEHSCDLDWKARKKADCGCPERDWWQGEKEAIEIQLTGDREVRELYVWWTKTRIEEKAAHDKMLEGVDMSFKFKPKETPEQNWVELDPTWRGSQWDAWVKENDRLEAKDEEMLRRLIEIRCRLWT